MHLDDRFCVLNVIPTYGNFKDYVRCDASQFIAHDVCLQVNANMLVCAQAVTIHLTFTPLSCVGVHFRLLMHK